MRDDLATATRSNLFLLIGIAATVLIGLANLALSIVEHLGAP